MQPIDTLLKDAFPTICETWDNSIIPALKEYIRIPNKSPDFDRHWEENGYMQKAMDLLVDWCEKQDLKGMSLSVHQAKNRTPLLYIEIPGQIEETILLYGHMDKQPEMAGWDDDKAPWKPVLQDGKLYGRGGADDGYAVFAAMTAIKTLQENAIPHARCVIIIEGSEESRSMDLPYYLKHLNAKIGKPNLVICLDSGAGNYEQLWSTTSLRGIAEATLDINVLNTGMHSGSGSGVVPSAMNILRQLLDRIEDPVTHQVTLDACHVDIPEQYVIQAKQAADMLGPYVSLAYPLADDTTAISGDLSELLLNRTWRAALTVTGMDGLPPIENAGNVTLPHITVKLSLRIPPTTDPDAILQSLKHALEKDPPFNATVKCTLGGSALGWEAPALAPWLAAANDKASELFYGKPAAYIGEGGTIPFMPMLGEMFPDAQFLIAGVLGPMSNAHGPNEFIHIDMAKRLTGAVASVIATHHDTFHG